MTTWEIILKLTKLDETQKEKSIFTLRKWCYRFMKRNFLSFLRASHIGQALPEKAHSLITNFLQFVIKQRHEHNFELDGMTNMDETLVYISLCLLIKFLRISW